MSFEQLNIIPPILDAVAEEGYITPTPIQQEAIPVILGGRDLVGCAQTGTGKTAAFAIPILQMLTVLKNSQQESPCTPEVDPSVSSADSGKGIKALILTPTRELALQIGESFETYGRYLPIRYAVVYGGVAQSNQITALHAGADILVATPGRLLDLVWQKYIDFANVRILVLDEADRMLDMGFAPDVKKSLNFCRKKGKTCCFPQPCRRKSNPW